MQFEPFEDDLRTTAQFDLTFSFNAYSSGLDLTIEYNTNLYEADFIQRLGQHLNTLLLNATALPDTSLDAIQYLAAHETTQLLEGFNQTGRPYNLTITPVDLISGSAEKHPDHIAIISDERQLTYRELWNEVETLSSYLSHKYHAKHGKVIGVQVSRTERLPLTLLAVWHTGAAYLPLDLVYPEERTHYILEDSGCDLVINDEWLEAYDQDDKSNLAPQPSAAKTDELAYVIYTSGSTGKPKGVMISHRNASSFIQWAQEEFDKNTYDILYAGTSHCFDLSIFEFFYSWATGKTIRIIQSGIHIQDYIDSDRKVLINTVPSVVQHLLGEPDFPWENVSVLNMAGEAVPSHFREVLDYNRIEVRNLYGPSETTTYSTCYRFSDEDEDIPVGRPVANTRIYILDINKKLVPAGVTGEVFIAGAGLTMGYRNKPELTDERYLEDPFNTSETMYMTGDLARWDNSGQIHYVGRKDHQVKLRGFRIELGEVEQAIERHQRIEKAVALVMPSGKKGPQLVAWVKASKTLDIKEIKGFIQEFLPPYMMPDHFQFMEEFPLTPNGKVNRAALKWDETSISDHSAEVILPGNDLEKKIFELWKEVLGKDAEFGVTNSFYEAGGNSLQAARLLSLLKQQIGISEGIRFVLENNTIEAQAKKLSKTDDIIELPILVVADHSAYSLNGFQERMWVLAKAGGGNEAYLLSGGIKIKGELDINLLERAFISVMERHHLLRAQFTENKYEEAQYTITPIKDLDFKLSVLKHPTTAEREEVVQKTLYTAIDLTKSLPIRALLLQYDRTSFELIYIIHHIVADGWSLKILERDLISSYTKLTQENNGQLTSLPVQFKDYVAWKGEQTDNASLQFWRKKLTTPLPKLTVAGSKPRPAEKSFNGSSTQALIPVEVANKLKDICLRKHTTLFSGLIGSLQMLLHRLSGQEDIIIGTAVAGRGHSALQDQVGPYLNTIPLRGSIKSNQAFDKVIDHAKETVHQALEYQHLPFADMLSLTNVPYTRNRSALFDVMAVFQNQEQADFGTEELMSTTGLSFNRLDLEEGDTSQMDLSFFFTEKDDELHLNLVYDTALFTEESIEQVIQRYQALLHGITNDVEATAADLIRLTEDEKQFITKQTKKDNALDIKSGRIKAGLPQSDLEKQLAELWSDVLGSDSELDIEDNFFEMGGNSLHAARLVSLIKRKIGLRQGVRFIFDQPTIKSQAIQITAEGTSRLDSIASAPEQETYPLSAFQERLWIMQSLQSTASQAYHVPGGMQVSGKLNRHLLEKAFVQLIEAQELLRTTFGENEFGEPYQKVLPTDAFTFTLEYRKVANEADVNAIINEHADRAFDLQAKLPIRALLLETSEDEFILAYCLHHIVCDGWSLKLMEKELMTNYLNLSKDESYQDNRNLVQFKDYVYWRSSQDQAQAKAYWKYKLRGPLPAFSLPVKHSRPKEKTFSGASVQTIVPNKSIKGLNQLCTVQGATLFTGLLASLKVVLTHFSGQEDIVIGTAVAGREHPDIQEIVGPFLNTLPIRTQVFRQQNFEQAMQAVKLSVVEAFDYQQVPFAEMLTLTRETYDVSRSPLFDIMAVYQNQQNAGIGGDAEAFSNIHGLKIQPLPEESSRTSQMDMSFFFVDKEEGLEMILVYNPDIYTEAIAKRLIQVYLQQLDAYVTEPERNLDTYEFLTEEELNLRNQHQEKTTEDNNTKEVPSQAVETKLPEGSMEEKLHHLWQTVLGTDLTFGLEDNFFQVGGNSLHAARLLSLIKRHIGISHNVRFVFEYNTIAKQAEYISATSEAAFETGIAKTPTRFYYPLSAFQERVYVLTSTKDGGEAYHVPGGLEFKGVVDKEILKTSFHHLIERHELLRSVFEENQYGEPVRRVLNEDEVEFDIVEYDINNEADLDEYISKITIEPFDLGKGLPIRVYFVKVSDRHQYLLYCLHHIVSDGWSIKVMERDLMDTYTLLQQGKKLESNPLPIQFQDYLAWKENQNQEEAETYWKEKLASPLPILEIPVDRRRPKEKTFNGKTDHLSISPEIVTSLNKFCLSNDTTFFTGLVASLRTLLWRYTNQKDIVIGTVISGRTHIDTEDQIGPYLNTLPLRNQINPSASFEEQLRTEKKVILDAFTYQDYPFVKMLDLPWVEYDSSRSPLFDVMAVYQNQEQAGIGGNVEGFTTKMGLEITALDDKGMRTSQMDMSFIFVSQPEGLTLSLVYNTDIYGEEFVERLLANYQTLLEDIASVNSKPVNQLETVSPYESKKQLEVLSSCQTSFPEVPLTQLFEEQVGFTPEGIAISDAKRELTYSELNDEVNQMASFLKELGVKTGDRVCIQMKRSADMIISALAVLKCGAAYVPVAIDYPADRKQMILDDSDCAVVINDDLYGRFQKVQDEFERNNPPVAASADSIAYIIYTSGSTGRPKGVVVTHRNIVPLTRSTDFVNVCAKDVLLQWSSFAFDGAVWDIFATLLNGAKMVMLTEGEIASVESIKSKIEANNVNLLFITTALFNVIVDTDISTFKPLRKLLFGGELVSMDHVDRALNYLGSGVMLHMYGPTEATVYATSYPIDSVSAQDLTVPIGSPLSNNTVYILDDNLQLLPQGVIGEICIGGDGLAVGYLNDTEKTDQKFIPHPFENGSRIYRSGDLGRWQENNAIAFMGRVDHQVKIRGHRIELSEIEFYLSQLPDVKKLLVDVRTDEQGDKYLCAYLVTEYLDEEAIRIHLRHSLPDYMVPDSFVAMEALPLTSNGKVDRKKLPDPVRKVADLIQPATETEKQLLSLWKIIIGNRPIGVTVSFAELGGHSLKATRLAAALRKTFSVELPLGQLLYTSIQEQAASIEVAESTLMSDIKSYPAKENYPLTQEQKGIVLADIFQNKGREFSMSGSMVLVGTLDTDVFKEAYLELFQQHDALRTTFTSDDNGDIRQWLNSSFADEQILWVKDISECDDKEAAISKISEQLYEQPLNLQEGPLIRLALIKRSNQDHVVIYFMHHAIADGWSLHLIQQKLLQNYIDLAKEARELPKRGVQYTDYALWQEELLNSGYFKPYEIYWKKQFDTKPEFARIEADEVVQASNGSGWYTITCDNLLFEAIQAKSQAKKLSLFALSYGAVSLLIHTYSGQTDITLPSPFAGRIHKDLEEVIGCFADQVLLRVRFNTDKTIDHSLKQIGDTVHQAYQYQAYPLSLMHEHLQNEFQCNMAKEGRLSVNFLNLDIISQEDENKILNDTGLSTESYHEGSFHSKYDINFVFSIHDNSLNIRIEYSQQRYDSPFIEKIADRLLEVFRTITEDSDISLHALRNRYKSQAIQSVIDSAMMELDDEF
ncbi:MAG: amino acid adenylation domain-containing protein [Cyclobacteriaceae bacterium]